ncbi:MAG: IS66 family insertion sequence element accessory protein TnpB [Gammaproteobacteria bacterium]|nr:IS66 family insertion sequence element accessory protein TnpB [Gammaproteobacteria bacterium]
MLGTTGVRVFLYSQPCDMRRQMNGLSAMVRQEMQRDPQSGELFVFRNRRRDMVKVLFYDELGCCLLFKRLSKGTFRIALAEFNDVTSIEISRTELASLLSNAKIVERTKTASRAA